MKNLSVLLSPMSLGIAAPTWNNKSNGALGRGSLLWASSVTVARPNIPGHPLSPHALQPSLYSTVSPGGGVLQRVAIVPLTRRDASLCELGN